MRRTFVTLAVLTLFVATASVAQTPPPYTAAVVIEPNSKKVLFEQNARTPLPVASMTKMMTLLIAMDMIKEGNLTFATPVTTSARASKMGGSQVFLKQGSQYPMQALLAATMIHSANDAAMAIAEHIGGTAEAFVNLMNQRAQSLGMKNSKFYTPHGLPGEPGKPDDVMSAYDAAILGIELTKYPLMKQYGAMQTMPFKSGTFEMMYNPNHLLRNYPGANGIKTGFHNKAGFCVTASANRNNMDLVAVVMGSKRKQDNFGSAANLLSEAFASYRMFEAIKKGSQVAQPAIVKGGEVSTVPVVAGAQARLFIKRAESGQVQTEVVSGNVAAPIRKGQQVGTVIVKLAGKPVARVPALAARDVAKEAWWKRWLPF